MKEIMERGRIECERPLKTSELANEENEGEFESNRKSQDEGYSSLNSSTFHNGAQAVGPEAVRHASRLGMTCTTAPENFNGDAITDRLDPT